MLLQWRGAEPSDPITDRSKDGEALCSAINCNNGRYMLSCKRKMFHSFPKDEDRCVFPLINDKLFTSTA